MGKKILFCLPYAGGSSYIYHNWKSSFQKQNIEVKALEYPGRGSRMDESFSWSLGELVEDLYRQVRSDILLYDYAIFGHSMGSLLAYELTKRIEKDHLPRPSCLFLSGAKTPWDHDRNSMLHLLPDEEFFKEIQKLGGIPDEVTSHPELLKLIIPILKSDFKLLGEHRFILQELNTPIICLNGRSDYKPQELNGWSNATSQEINFFDFQGDHFYLNDNANALEIFEIISSHLKPKPIRV